MPSPLNKACEVIGTATLPDITCQEIAWIYFDSCGGKKKREKGGSERSVEVRSKECHVCASVMMQICLYIYIYI